MKSVFCFLSLMIIGASLNGQNNMMPYDFGIVKTKLIENPNTIENNIRPSIDPTSNDRALNILWTEDFSGSSSLVTSNGTWTLSGLEGTYWSFSSNNTNPLGYLNYMSGRHLLWDSYTPVSAIEPNNLFATTPVEGSVISPIIDLSGYTNAIMTFDINGLYCCNNEPWTVSVSNDNGINWGSEIPLNLGLDDNTSTNNLNQPFSISINISPYLDLVSANNNDVKLRFSWTAISTNMNNQMSSHYSWEIDNISIYETPPFDIKQDKLWLEDISDGFEYTSLPAEQASNLTVQSTINNNGLNIPTNLALEVTVLDLTNTIIAGPVVGGLLSSPPFSAGNSDTITFDTNIDLSTFSIGEYKVISTLIYDETDETPENDTLIRTIKITNNTMGHVDYDTSPSTLINNIEGSKIGAKFLVTEHVELQGVSFFIETAQTGGVFLPDPDSIIIKVLMFNDVSLEFDEIMAYSYDFNNNMLGNWYNFDFDQANNNSELFTIEAGNIYIVSFEALNLYKYRANSSDTDYSGVIYNNGQWHWLGNDPYVILNLIEIFDLKDQENNPMVLLTQNQPNPFKDYTIINYKLNETANVTLEILDVTGKVILSINEGYKGIGQYQISISSDQLSSGIYFYKFTAGEFSTSKKMIINK